MKRILIAAAALGFSLAALSCNNKSSPVRGVLNWPFTGGDTGAGAASAPAKITYVYGAYFDALSAGYFQTLLEACRRCGLERNVFGSYQREWILGPHPRKCSQWTGGYIQIEFMEKKLPSQAVVSIMPGYTGYSGYSPGSGEVWGEPFAVKALARPINENEGFEIILNPRAGLGGVRSLKIQSEGSNHVLQNSLDISVYYGSFADDDSGQELISETLPKLTKKAIRDAIFSCDTYVTY